MATETKVRLYRASSVLPELRGHANVSVDWYVGVRRGPVAPYAELIEGYAELEAGADRAHRAAEWTNDDPRNFPAFWAHLYAQFCVNELFTAEEAEALRVYLRQRHGDGVAIEEVPLPVRCEGREPFLTFTSAFAGGDLYLHQEEGYALPFHVSGRPDLPLPEVLTVTTESERE